MQVEPMLSGARHVPVLAREAVESLVWRDDGFYVDATLGIGGHAEGICTRLTGSGKLLGIDRDPAAHAHACLRLMPWAERVIFRQASFGELGLLLEGLNVGAVSGVLFDLGVSSLQLDTPERGFSHRFRGPLDMRMGPDASMAAEEVVNSWQEEELIHLFRTFGEEPHARPIARAIIRERTKGPIRDTEHLARIVGRRGRERPEKTLARVFQSLRIAVNRELDELERGLGQALDHLEPRGRVVVIAYHSLEDRLVKRWMRREASECICPPGVPICRCGHCARLRLLTRRAVTPTPEETVRNPRARSARMRVAERLGPQDGAVP